MVYTQNSYYDCDFAPAAGTEPLTCCKLSKPFDKKNFPDCFPDPAIYVTLPTVTTISTTTNSIADIDEDDFRPFNGNDNKRINNGFRGNNNGNRGNNNGYRGNNNGNRGNNNGFGGNNNGFGGIDNGFRGNNNGFRGNNNGFRGNDNSRRVNDDSRYNGRQTNGHSFGGGDREESEFDEPRGGAGPASGERGDSGENGQNGGSHDEHKHKHFGHWHGKHHWGNWHGHGWHGHGHDHDHHRHRRQAVIQIPAQRSVVGVFVFCRSFCK